jgi:hypothetical protein
VRLVFMWKCFVKWYILPPVSQVSSPTCDTCDQALSRPFVCLHCSFAGCWSEGHITNHLKETGHTFCSCFCHHSFRSADYSKSVHFRHRYKVWISLLFRVRGLCIWWYHWRVASLHRPIGWRAKYEISR